MKILKHIATALLISASCYAQKLPNVQQGGLRAPANIKIDGKPIEWSDLQAYNKAVDLSYSLANDAKNLYLTVQTDKPRIFEKILGVGVTLTINKNGAKDYKNSANTVVTYPLLDIPTAIRIMAAAGIKSDNVKAYVNGPKDLKMNNLVVNESQTDSLKDAANKMLKTASKTLKIKGFQGLPDTLSIYNEHDILAAIDYSKNGKYTYELQIPLKLVGIVSSTTLISYSIKLRSRLEDNKKGMMTITKYDKAGNTINPNQDLDADTDFWGEYTLVK